MKNTLRVGVLGSTNGTDLRALLRYQQKGDLDAEIVCVISNKEDAGILNLAREYDVEAIFADPGILSREDYDARLASLLNERSVDLVVFIGYMRIVTATLLDAFPERIINVHPSLLPKYAGKMNKSVHEMVLENGDIQTGMTIHLVNEVVDGGRILLQKSCTVEATDTPETLKAKVQALEAEGLREIINHWRI